MISLSASTVRSGTLVRWRTASDRGTLGFNVYRQATTKRIRINTYLIAATRTVGGHVYSYVDRKAPRNSTARYWIQSVGTDGFTVWFGPAR